MAKKLNAAQEAQQIFARLQQGVGNVATQFSSGAKAMVNNLNQSRNVVPNMQPINYGRVLNNVQRTVQPSLQQFTHTLGQQPILGPFTPARITPTISQTVNTVLPNFKQSTIGTALQGNFSQIPKAYSQDIARARQTFNTNTPEGVNNVLGGVMGTTQTKAFTKQQIETVRKGFSPEVRNLVGRFAQAVEQNPQANRKQLGQLGDYIQSLGETVFGNKAANLTNKQLKNAFDAIMQEAATKGMGKKFSIGLVTNDIRQGTKAKISAKQVTQPIPETPMQGQTASQGQARTSIGQQGGSSFGSSSKKIIPRIENPTDPYFNVNKLNVNKKAQAQVKRVVEESKPGIEKLVGTKLSNKEAVNLANNSAKVLHRTVSRQETLAWEGKMLKARQLLADQAKDGKVTQEYINNLFAIKSQGTDIARKLQSLGIGADPQSVTAKQAILESILKVNQNTDEILRAANGVDFNDLNQATKFYRQFVAPKKEEWIDLLRYNSMLSSPNTHIINTSSNFQGTGIIAPIEKTILGGVDFLKSAVTGKPRQYAVGEGAAYAKGYYSNLKNAAFKFSDVMRGKSMVENPDLRNIPLTTSGKGRIAENVLATPMRLLEGMDQFFTTLTRGGVESGLKYRASRGIKVLNPEIKAQQEAAQRLFRGDFSPEGQGYVLGVLDSGANTVMMLRNSENPVVRTIAKYTLPFVKTPTNILKQGIEYSPLGLSTLAGASNKTEQFTKALMGTSIAAGVATLLGSDRLTWAEPTNPTAKNKFRDAGLQPYAVKIGNNWVSYAKLHPAIAFNLAFVSALRDAEQNKRLGDEDIETALTGLTKWVNFFADQSYVKNIGDFIASTKGDIEGPARYIANYPQQLIPFRALMGWAARLTDPNQRQVDKDGSILGKQLQQLMTQIPGLSQNVPARLNSIGEPIENQNKELNAFSPARVTTENPQGRQIYDQSVEKSRQTKLVNDAKKQLESSNETYKEVDNIIVYKGSDGKDHTIDTSKQPEKPELTGETTLDKQLISKYNSQVTSKINDITEMFKLGEYTRQEAAALITDLQGMKLSTKKRYSTMKPTGNETIDKLLYSKQLGELTSTRNKVLEDLQNEKITNQDAEFLLKEIENRQKVIKVKTAKPKKPKAITLPKARKVRARVTTSKPLKIKAPKVKIPKFKPIKVKSRKRVRVGG